MLRGYALRLVWLYRTSAVLLAFVSAAKPAFYAALYGLYGQAAAQRIDEVLAAVEPTDRADDRFSSFSSGMRQRLAIARALMHRPQPLFLDEPTRSLDPTHTLQLHDLIMQLMDSLGMTVFLITHDLVEAEKRCDRVAVMHRGRIQAVVHRPNCVANYNLSKIRIDSWHDFGQIKSRLLLADPEIQIDHHRISFTRRNRATSSHASLICCVAMMSSSTP